MFSSVTKITIGLGVILSLSFIAVQATNSRTPRPWVQYVCPNTYSTVWASDGRKCYVYRNLCYFRNACCQMPGLRIVSRAACQRLCQTFCTLEYNPVCAEYKGVRKQFGNLCGLENYVCKSGEPYHQIPLSACNLRS